MIIQQKNALYFQSDSFRRMTDLAVEACRKVPPFAEFSKDVPQEEITKFLQYFLFVAFLNEVDKPLGDKFSPARELAEVADEFTAKAWFNELVMAMIGLEVTRTQNGVHFSNNSPMTNFTELGVTEMLDEASEIVAGWDEPFFDDEEETVLIPGMYVAVSHPPLDTEAQLTCFFAFN